MKLTPTQQAMLLFIKGFIKAMHYPPTQAEIAKGMDYKSQNAASDGLKLLEKNGAIKRTPNLARSIRVMRP